MIDKEKKKEREMNVARLEKEKREIICQKRANTILCV